MGSVNFLSTSNFSFTIISTDSNGLSTIEVKPTTKEAKALYRFKKWGKLQTVQSDRAQIFSDAEAYEQKIMALAAI